MVYYFLHQYTFSSLAVYGYTFLNISVSSDRFKYFTVYGAFTLGFASFEFFWTSSFLPACFPENELGFKSSPICCIACDFKAPTWGVLCMFSIALVCFLDVEFGLGLLHPVTFTSCRVSVSDVLSWFFELFLDCLATDIFVLFTGEVSDLILGKRRVSSWFNFFVVFTLASPCFAVFVSSSSLCTSEVLPFVSFVLLSRVLVGTFSVLFAKLVFSRDGFSVCSAKSFSFLCSEICSSFLRTGSLQKWKEVKTK